MAITEARRVDAVRVAGKVKRGKLIVPSKIALPDGAVEVTVVTGANQRQWKKGLSKEELLKHPAFGMWKRRTEMANPAAYVRAMRKLEDNRSKRAR